MDHNIKRKTDAGSVPPEAPAAAPATASADLRGQYQYPLIEIARTVAQMAAQRDKMTTHELLTAPCPLEPHSALVVAARGACLERGFLADGQVPRGSSTGDRREEPIKENKDRPLDLNDIEGHAKAGWRITLTPKTVIELVLLARVGQAAQAQEAAAPAGWLDAGERRPEHGQAVWISILTEYRNAPAVQGVESAVYEYGRFRDAHSENTLRWPTHWMPRERPAPPLLKSDA